MNKEDQCEFVKEFKVEPYGDSPAIDIEKLQEE